MKAYSDRAKWRFRCARRLLQERPERYGFPAGWRLDDGPGLFEAIVAALAQLAPAASGQLQRDVDWLEGYESGTTHPDMQARWDAQIEVEQAARLTSTT